MKDLTKIKTPFGLLKPKVQDRLLAHLRANGLIEMFWSPAWKDSTSDRFDDRFTYRAKPGFPILPNDEALKEVVAAFKPANLPPSTTPIGIFAAVKEWQEARANMGKDGGSIDRWEAALNALAAIVVPS